MYIYNIYIYIYIYNKHPVTIMTDKSCEELAFPVLFPKGRFGYKDNRKIKLSPVK